MDAASRKVRPKHVSGLKFDTLRICAPANDRPVLLEPFRKIVALFEPEKFSKRQQISANVSKCQQMSASVSKCVSIDVDFVLEKYFNCQQMSANLFFRPQVSAK
jgi:hypothetical protein